MAEKEGNNPYEKPQLAPVIQRFPDCENFGTALSFYCRVVMSMEFAENFLIGLSDSQKCTYLYVMFREDDPIKLGSHPNICDLTGIGASLEATCLELPQPVRFRVRYLRPSQVEETENRWLVENERPLIKFKFTDLSGNNRLKLD